MTTPLACLILVAILPYVLAGVGARYRVAQLGSLDARQPRTQAAELEGVAARALAAQNNAWEAVAFFGSAVVVNHLAGAAPGPSAALSVAYVVTRILHPVFYIGDRPAARTAVFVVGLVCAISLFGYALRAG
jgi:uncharacterized MAPEG superfamily protein